MSALDRALLALFALLVTLLSLAILVVIAGWMVPLDLLQLSLTMPDYRIISTLVVILLLLLSLRFLLVGLRRAVPGESQAVIRTADLGTASIALPALENLVIRAARQVKGVREIRPVLKVLPEGLQVKLMVTVNPDRNLPELSASLQEKVHEYLTATTGLEVTEVRVRVNGIYQEGLRRVE